jgi:hypothetical protein
MILLQAGGSMSVNPSQRDDPRFWKKWRATGAAPIDIIEIVNMVRTTMSLHSSIIRRLDKEGRFRVTTSFRHHELVPGEVAILNYEFEEEGVKHFGFIGRDKDNELITIDERFPTERLRYRKGTLGTPEWVEEGPDRFHPEWVPVK